jgi:hypothetical protein|tara:strand:- start:2194 stop:2346 length:153 start_codon:yes stop_codon:yes gene_type:complete
MNHHELQFLEQEEQQWERLELEKALELDIAWMEESEFFNKDKNNETTRSA